MTQNIFLHYIIYLSSIIISIALPLHRIHASVSITEVAWMGTTTSQYEEWIELYNMTDEPITMTGWKLLKKGSLTLIGLSGTIPAQSYYLVCRSTASLSSPLGGSCDEQGAFGGSGLNNTSDEVILVDSTNSEQDRIDAQAGWPAGEASSKKTLQRLGTTWVTASATAGTATLTPETPDDSENSDDTDDSDDTNPDNTPPPSPPPKNNSGILQGTPASVEKKYSDPLYKATMIIPDHGTVGVRVPMKATVTKDTKQETLRGRFEWSMGDGGSYKFLKNTPLDHIFYYPGNYTVVMQYYSDIFREEPDTIHRKTITIAPDDLYILGYSPTDGLRIKNESTKDIALDGWIIQSSGQEFIFPKFTTIQKGSTLAFSPKVLGISVSTSSIVLLNPSREMVSRYSYAYRAPSDDEEVVIPESTDLSALQNIAYSADGSLGTSSHTKNPSQPLPHPKTLVRLWTEYPGYILLGGGILISILAYLAFHLYAKQDELI